MIGKRNDRVPLRRLLYRCDAGGGVQFLVRPEAPTYPVAFKQRPEGGHPFILIFARLAHPDGHVVLVAEIDIFLDGLLLHVHPIFMKGVSQPLVKRRPEDFEIGIPLCPSEKDHVIFIHAPNSGHNLSVERLKFWI